MTSPSGIKPGDRVAPKRPAARPAPAMSKPRWLLPALAAGGVFVLAGGGFAAYSLLMDEAEPPRRKASAIVIGPLAEMPDLRDGVPALMTKPRPATAPGAPSPTPPALAAVPSSAPIGVATPPAAPTASASRSVPPAAAEAAPAPAAAMLDVEDANRRAMASTIATAGLRPGLAGPARETPGSPSGPAQPPRPRRRTGGPPGSRRPRATAPRPYGRST